MVNSSGQRVRKTTINSDAGITEMRKYVGGWEVFEKRDDNDDILLSRESLHVSDDTGRIVLIETQTDVLTPEPVLRYQYSNHLGSATLELDEDGAVISYEECYPYGSTSFQAGRSLSEVSLKRYRYTGKERDEETGLYYHGARYYIPWLARWGASDPINNEQYNIEQGKPMRNLERTHTELSASSYEYAYDNPVVYNDPSGEQPPTKEYRQSTFQKALNAEHYFAKLVAKVAGGTFTVEGFGSVSFGSVRTHSFGKGTDQYGNVALFYSRTATETPSVSTNLGAEIGGKIAVLPGYDDVSDIKGKAFSFTVSGSLDKIGVPLSAGASLEYNLKEQLVGFGLQLSGGASLLPFSWSMEATQTSAVIFGKGDYQKFMDVASNIDKIGVSTMLNWNRNSTRADNGDILGSWMYTGGVLDYIKAGKDEKGNQLYEGVVNLQFDFRTSGEGARLGVKPVNTTMEIKTNTYFTMDTDGNYISTGFKKAQ